MEKKEMRVCVIGLGYIGLPTAALLANNGYNVLGVDINPEVVATINSGKIHIVEPDLDAFVHSAVNSNKLVASLKPEKADVFIIAVPTPFKQNYEPDLSFVIEATKSIVPYIQNGNTVILESTSPVGSTKMLQNILKDNGIKTDEIFLAYCPERVLPGKIMKELTENDRVVGGIDQKSTDKVKQFYESFVTGLVLEADSQTAEMCKLVENAYRDVNIAFANELSLICHKNGVNVTDLINLANHHPRVKILQPGVGVGGHCIAVDPWFLISNYKSECRIIKEARHVNENKTQWVINQIIEKAKEFEIVYSKKPIIACMGLSFKPDIDDLRESPSLYIANKISNIYSDTLFVEPNLSYHNDFELTDIKTAINDADILCFLVKHKSFNNLSVNQKIILDFCGLKI